jgi:hypothetical protein
MSRKIKLSPVDVVLPHAEFFGDLKALFEGRFHEYQITRHLRHLKEDYDDGHALAALEAFWVVRMHEMPVPEWVLQYLTKSVERLFTFRKGRLPGKDEIAGHMLVAFGMHTAGRGTGLSRYFDSHNREAVVKAVLKRLQENPKENLRQACNAVAKKNNIKIKTVENWFQQHRGRFLPKEFKPGNK